MAAPSLHGRAEGEGSRYEESNESRARFRESQQSFHPIFDDAACLYLPYPFLVQLYIYYAHLLFIVAGDLGATTAKSKQRASFRP